MDLSVHDNTVFLYVGKHAFNHIIITYLKLSITPYLLLEAIIKHMDSIVKLHQTSKCVLFLQIDLT